MMAEKDLSIIQLNDSHGYLELHHELFYKGDHPEFRKTGGFGRISTVLNNLRREMNGNVLVLDCGDTIHGTYPAVQTKGEMLVPILNKIKFDAWTGHWEFGYGPEQLKKITRMLHYPFLAINCYDKNTGERVFDPYKIFEINGVRIGVIGIAASIVDKVMPEWFSEGIEMTLGNEELPGLIEKLRMEEHVDLVLALSHLGYPQDVKLAAEVDGIDILLSGHTHNRLRRPTIVNNTIIFQSGCHGSFLGRLDLKVSCGRITAFSHELIEIDESIEPDPEIEDLINALMKPHRELLSEELGVVETPLHRYRVLESTMDNFLLKSLMRLTGAQMAFSNGWRYGAPIVPGKITISDLWNIIPVNPPVQTCKLTGAELWNMMEKNLERTFSRDPYQQMGGYVKRCMGLNLYFKIENDNNQRIEELFVQGERVNLKKAYDVCFVTSQGVRKEYGHDRKKLDVNAIDAMIKYIEDNQRIYIRLENSINAI
jgi:2',3'-cyclic-nucleotide 2'-phosphodiesterase (5'-nucleotidase family)